jgi:hypothetical protein
MNEEKPSTAPSGEGATGPCARFGAELDTLLRSLAPSEDVRQHFTNARIELLKGVRSLIDDRIQRLSSEHRKGTSVTIE